MHSDPVYGKKGFFQMKKTLFLLAIGCAAVLAAEELPVGLKTAKIGAPVIPGWIINKSAKAVDYGKGEIVAASEAGKMAFKISAPADRGAAFYTARAFPVKIGQVLEISAKVKGKGSITLGFYGYNNGAKFLGGIANTGKTFQLQEGLTKVKAEIVIGSAKTGELNTLRPAITVSAGGEAVIEDLEIEIENRD